MAFADGDFGHVRERDAGRAAWWGVSLVVAVVTLVALAGLPRMTFEDDFRRLLGLEAVEDGTAAATRESACLVLVESPELLTPAGIAALEELAARLEGVDGVGSVRSILDFRSTSREGDLVLLPALLAWSERRRVERGGSPDGG